MESFKSQIPKCMASGTKQIKLRAFSISNYAIDKKDSGLMELLASTLSGSIAKDRKMRLNPDDPQNEEDLISDYSAKEGVCINGAVLRISSSGDIPNIPDDYLDKEKITIMDLDSIQMQSSIIYKMHYYFALNSTHIVTNLQGNIPIKRFETYINWFLENIRGELMFEFIPCTTPTPQTRLSEIANMAFKNNTVGDEFESQSQEGFVKSKVSKAGADILKLLIGDTEKFQVLKDAQIISAELLIKFSKPSKMKKEDYEKLMGMYLKPIAETDDVVFTTKKGTKVKGSDILRTKVVDIELTDSKKISEPQLFQEMERFLKELKNENGG
ncbi:hypothetical protein [Petrimonas sulfuriphila]|uniref:hypothetical protein n=1 Tax=Petrimonas sulfuriphila TaxID=285070 RepID=UPI003EBC838B